MTSMPSTSPDPLLRLLDTLRSRLSLPTTPILAAQTTFLALLILSDFTTDHAGHMLFKTLSSLTFVYGGLSLLGLAPTTTEEVSELGTAWGKILELPAAKQALLAGLAVSVLGDIFLIPDKKDYVASRKASTSSKDSKAITIKPSAHNVGLDFQVGTGFFALAHIAYTAAFLLSSLSSSQPFNLLAFALSTTAGLSLSHFLGLLPPRPAPPGSWRPQLSLPADMKPLVIGYIFIINAMVGVATATSGGGVGWQRAVGAWMFMISDAFVAVDAFGEGVVGCKTRAVGWCAYFWAQMVIGGCLVGL